MPDKRKLLTLGAAIVSAFIIFIAAESFFMLFPAYKIPGKWNFLEEDAGTTELDGLKLQGNLNSMGLREDVDYPFEHQKYRVIAMGDSFTYGLWLRNINSWPKKTQQYLQDKGYKDIEVLNAGHPGTNTQQQLIFFKNYTYKFNPDMVIVGFIINDCSELCSNCGAVELKKQFDEIIKKSKNKFGLYTFNYIRFNYLRYKLTDETVKEYNMPYEKKTRTFQQCEKAFLDFKELSQKNNFKLIVVIYPLLTQLDKNYPFSGIHKKMGDFFKEADIEYYDFTGEFFGYKDTDLWISFYDSHPNKKANEIFAKKITEIILKYYSPNLGQN